MDMKDVLKILLRLFEQGFSKEVIFFYCFDGKYETAKRRVSENFTLSKRVALRLLALAASDRWKAEIIIAYPVCNIMEERSPVIVCSVNIGNLINTRRKVLEGCIIQAVSIVFVIRDS